jgi:hypothetical protein
MVGADGEQVLRAIAREAAHEAVRETLIALGIDAKDPVAFQERMAFLKSLEQLSKAATRHGILALVALCTLGVAAAVWAQLGGPK